MKPTPLKYEDFDRKLLEEIAAGRSSFAHLCATLAADAQPFQLAPGAKTEAPAWRVVERRLQDLRKKGLITYTYTHSRGGYWSPANPS
jgi:hypothetical protein